MQLNSCLEIPSNCQMMANGGIISTTQSLSTPDLYMSPLTAAPRSTSQKKYLVCCLICGSFSCLLGAMFLGVYFLIRSYTMNGYFETVPTYVPAAMLILTGLCTMGFASRKNRYTCLIYFSGTCSAASAFICAAVTVITKILHMSRLQDLNCEFKIQTRLCICYSVYADGQDKDKEILFEAGGDCRVAQGDLYSCLQAIFGLSMVGVLITVFSTMLSYLLFSHERKKRYWEQLDMRCRLLHASYFGSQPPFPPSLLQTSTSITNNQHTAGNTCGCCEQCQLNSTAFASGYPNTNQILASQNYALGDDVYVNNNCNNSNNDNGDGNGNISKYLTIGRNFNNNFTNRRQNSQNNNNNNNNTSSGWRWPRLPWQRNNLELNLFQQAALLSSHRSPTLYNFQSWPEFLAAAATATTPPHYLGNNLGYPLGLWGPPPPPYSDPNSPDWRNGVQYDVIESNCSDNSNRNNNSNASNNNNNNNNNNDCQSDLLTNIGQNSYIEQQSIINSVPSNTNTNVINDGRDENNISNMENK